MEDSSGERRLKLPIGGHIHRNEVAALTLPLATSSQDYHRAILLARGILSRIVGHLQIQLVQRVDEVIQFVFGLGWLICLTLRHADRRSHGLSAGQHQLLITFTSGNR